MKYYVFALLTTLFWGISPVIEKLAVSRLSPLTAVSIRSFFVTIVLSAVFLSSGGFGEAMREPKAIFYVALGALFAGLLGQLTYFYALKEGEASRVVPIIASYPVVAFIVGITFLGEAITLPKVAGVVLVGLGILLLI